MHRTIIYLHKLLLHILCAIQMTAIPASSQLQLPIFDLIYHMTNKFNESIHDTTTFLHEYDFIVIGSGSGGSVVANRLSENPNWNILLLEAGAEENFVSDVPLTPSITQLTSTYSCHWICSQLFFSISMSSERIFINFQKQNLIGVTKRIRWKAPV